jgi:hypothetical protein
MTGNPETNPGGSLSRLIDGVEAIDHEASSIRNHRKRSTTEVEPSM